MIVVSRIGSFHNKNLRASRMPVIDCGANRKSFFARLKYEKTTTSGGLVDGPRSAGADLGNHFC